MNLRYYLRGLGVGILVTAVIMEVAAGGKKETLSNAEIKERAAALGMVEESGRLSDLETKQPDNASAAVSAEQPTKEPAALLTEKQETEPTEAPTEKPTEAPTEAPTETPTERPTEAPTVKPTALPTAKPTANPTVKPEEETKKANTDTVFLAVKSGEGSYTVCQKLEDAGLIASASDFDRYLYENGYDKKLRIGNYEIPADAEPETIAEILTFGK